MLLLAMLLLLLLLLLQSFRGPHSKMHRYANGKRRIANCEPCALRIYEIQMGKKASLHMPHLNCRCLLLPLPRPRPQPIPAAPILANVI